MVKSAYLIAPSSKIKSEHLENAKEKIKLLDLDFSIYSNDVLDSDIYFAGTLQRRVLEVNKAFNSDVNYIFALKGGYAIMELFNKLDWNQILKSNKTIMGFSDISAFLLALISKNYKGILVHGPNLGLRSWKNKNKYISLIKKSLNNENYEIDLNKYKTSYKNKSDFSGKIIGGNLRIISLLFGTHYELQTNFECVLFLEDIRERPAALYTMLLQLEMTGKLKNIKALILGKMIKCDIYIPLIERFLERLNIPIIYEIPIGHQKDMIPIRLMSQVIFDSKNNILKFNSI